MRKTLKDSVHTAIGSVLAALVVAAILAGVLLIVAPFTTIHMMRPLTCPGGVVSEYWWSESGRLGVICRRPGAAPADVGDRTFLMLTAILALPFAMSLHVLWGGPSRAYKKWSRRWQR